MGANRLLNQIDAILQTKVFEITLPVNGYTRFLAKPANGKSKPHPAAGEEKKLSPLHQRQKEESEEWRRQSMENWERERPQRIAQALKLAKKTAKKEREKKKAARQDKKAAKNQKPKVVRDWPETTQEERLDHEYHSQEDLKHADIEQLFAKGYKKAKISVFGKGGSRMYWVKNRYNEGKVHAFFCFFLRDMIHDIEGIKVELNVKNGPDVVFDWKGKKAAIDVETGSNEKRQPKYLARRYEEWEKYYDPLFIFVTSKKLKRKYAKYGNVITRGTFRKTMGNLFKEAEEARERAKLGLKTIAN